MTRVGKVCLLGQAMVDVTLGNLGEPTKLRLGGILHAARALWAMDIPYTLAHISPRYMSAQVERYALHHGAQTVVHIGEVTGSPNVILIGEAKEISDQGYEYLLRDELIVELDGNKLKEIVADSKLNDIFVFPGGFDLETVLSVLGSTRSRIHLDIAYGVSSISTLNALGRSIDVISSSTSSDLFLQHYKGKVNKLWSDAEGLAHALLFKENRGGSRLFKRNSDQPIRGSAQIRPIVHSVGVGDCYDVAFALKRLSVPDEAALGYASFIAAEYAATTFPDDFKRGVGRVLKLTPEDIVNLEGVSIPWESRPRQPIYVAAPDFDFVDTRSIDEVADALRYHNFRPRLPVREHGQMGARATSKRRQDLCQRDLALLDECCMVVAVLIGNDPGTLIEIGIAVERGMPVVVYDPYKHADNLMLTQLPDLVSSNLEEVISAVFKFTSKHANKI